MSVAYCQPMPTTDGLSRQWPTRSHLAEMHSALWDRRVSRAEQLAANGGPAASLLASADKLGAASPYVIAPVTEASTLVTERSVPQDATAPYSALGIAVVRA